jgi:hypothetical protein
VTAGANIFCRDAGARVQPATQALPGGSLDATNSLVADLTANTPLKPEAWTFASPNVGDAIFAAGYGALSMVSWRIYNQVDVVPYFPVDVFDDYQPVPAGYAINSLGKAKWSPSCAHALDAYSRRENNPGTSSRSASRHPAHLLSGRM